MADHPGKFDIEAAKKFALVPRLHYAALKRGESVVASAPPPSRARAHVSQPHSSLQLTVLKCTRLKWLPRPPQANHLPLLIIVDASVQYTVKARAVALLPCGPTLCCITLQP